MACGYYDMRRKEDRETERIYNDSLKTKQLIFLKYGSVITDKSLFDCSFENYKLIDAETETAAEIAKKIL